VSKQVSERNYSYGNVFVLQVHFHVNISHFHMKGFARRLKWPIELAQFVLPVVSSDLVLSTSFSTAIIEISKS